VDHQYGYAEHERSHRSSASDSNSEFWDAVEILDDIVRGVRQAQGAIEEEWLTLTGLTNAGRWRKRDRA
jgi:hypothetical protein